MNNLSCVLHCLHTETYILILTRYAAFPIMAMNNCKSAMAYLLNFFSTFPQDWSGFKGSAEDILESRLVGKAESLRIKRNQTAARFSTRKMLGVMGKSTCLSQIDNTLEVELYL